MNLSIGIVGLPNVGKSTLFNALLKKQQALAANYPFATIEPNIGIVPVPDERLQKLAEITKTEEKMDSLPPIKPATVEFVDIAGIVKGASEGAGLGNKFLSHIREVKIIVHVVRVFEDPDVIKEGSVDPKNDYETINTELMLSDVQSLQKMLENRKLEPTRKVLMEKFLTSLNSGVPARNVILNEEEKELAKEIFLISSKPEMVVLNVAEDKYNPETIKKYTEEYAKILGIPDSHIVVISAKIESDLSDLALTEQAEYLKSLGLEESGLERLIRMSYHALGLLSFLTCGEKEVRAWTIKQGMDAQHASGEIHTDFIKHFIKAEIVSYADFVSVGGWKKAKELGKARMEGKTYIIQDGDVLEFMIGR